MRTIIVSGVVAMLAALAGTPLAYAHRGPNDLNGGGYGHSWVPAAAPAPVTPAVTRPGLR